MIKEEYFKNSDGSYTYARTEEGFFDVSNIEKELSYCDTQVKYYTEAIGEIQERRAKLEALRDTLAAAAPPVITPPIEAIIV